MKKKPTARENNEHKLILQLYVSGMSQKSMQAIENIKKLCGDHPDQNIELEIIDIYKHPEVAQQEHIVFCPSLIKRHPLPKKVLVGNLSNTEKVISSLGIVTKS